MDPWLLGSLLLLPYHFVPEGFENCAGQKIPIGDGQLFKLLGTQFGGNGETNFGLPDLRDHEPIAGLRYCISTNGVPPS
jgi:microcystin-dependent protein